jgi:hypothetical protein
VATARRCLVLVAVTDARGDTSNEQRKTSTATAAAPDGNFESLLDTDDGISVGPLARSDEEVKARCSKLERT